MTSRRIAGLPGAELLATALIVSALVPGRPPTSAQQAHISATSVMAAQGPGVADVLLTGRPLILFVFATWCKYSTYEARYVVPRLAAYVARHHGRVVGIDETGLLGLGRAGPPGHPAAGDSRPLRPHGYSDGGAFQAAVSAYRRAFRLPIPLVADPRLTLKRHLGLYFAGAYPTFIFMTATGRAVMRADGAQPFTALATTFDDARTLR